MQLAQRMQTAQLNCCPCGVYIYHIIIDAATSQENGLRLASFGRKLVDPLKTHMQSCKSSHSKVSFLKKKGIDLLRCSAKLFVHFSNWSYHKRIPPHAGVCKIFKLSYYDMLNDILWKTVAPAVMLRLFCSHKLPGRLSCRDLCITELETSHGRVEKIAIHLPMMPSAKAT